MENETCIFCQIIAGKAKAELYYQDDLVTAFRDIRPVAPVHVLIVPNEHISSVNQLQADHREIVGQLLIVAGELAKKFNIDQSGYRIIINTGKHGGQEINHLHAHLLGGHRMRFPVG